MLLLELVGQSVSQSAVSQFAVSQPACSQSASQPFSQSVCSQPASQSVNQSVCSQSVSQPASQSVSLQSVSQSVSLQPASHPVSHSVCSQSISLQPASQPASQSVSQSSSWRTRMKKLQYAINISLICNFSNTNKILHESLLSAFPYHLFTIFRTCVSHTTVCGVLIRECFVLKTELNESALRRNKGTGILLELSNTPVSALPFCTYLKILLIFLSLSSFVLSFSYAGDESPARVVLKRPEINFHHYHGSSRF